MNTIEIDTAEAGTVERLEFNINNHLPEDLSKGIPFIEATFDLPKDTEILGVSLKGDSPGIDVVIRSGYSGPDSLTERRKFIAVAEGYYLHGPTIIKYLGSENVRIERLDQIWYMRFYFFERL